MPATITITETIFVAASPETVWDFTQDYSKRHLWDKMTLEAHVIQQQPLITFVKWVGGLTTEFHYKLNERPVKTSVAMANTKSPIISGGGGSWHYEESGGGTMWTQTNSLILRKNILASLSKVWIRWMLKSNTRKAMMVAKRMMEKQL